MRTENLLRRLPGQRCGLSVTEFVGSLIALAGGMVIGLLYLGVDLQKAGQQLLGQDETTFAEDRGTENPETTVSQSAQPGEDAVQVNTTPRKPTELEVHQATSDYWLALSQCLSEELDGRYQQTTGGTRLQQDYLTLRTQGHLAAVETISQLDTVGVDPQLVEHGEQLRAWHEAAAELFKKAGDLLATTAQRDGQNPLAQDWRTTSIQLQKEEQMLMNGHRALAAYLNHKYPNSAPFTPVRTR